MICDIIIYLCPGLQSWPSEVLDQSDSFLMIKCVPLEWLAIPWLFIQHTLWK